MLIGIQGSGKSAFFKERFADTHVRINRDMLKTLTRERRFFELCLATGQRCVVDNTNPTRDERRRFLLPAKEHGFSINGYFFDVPAREAIARNALRPPHQRVPVPGIYGTAKRLQRPEVGEGFDALFRVTVTPNGFDVTALSEPSPT